MQKITDQQMAEALGWKPCKCGHCDFWLPPKVTDLREAVSIPEFTTKVDVIKDCIEKHGIGLWWKTGSGVVVGGSKEEAYFAQVHGGKEFYAEHPALALCLAFLNHLGHL